MNNPVPDPTVAWDELGIVAAALMHDLQSLIVTAEDYALLAQSELTAHHLSGGSAAAAARKAHEAREMIRDVLEVLQGNTASEAFQPLQVVRETIELVAADASVVEIRLRDEDTAGRIVAGRASLFRRAIGNLVRNAVRHADSVVEVVLETQDAEIQGVQVRVCDDGPGISADVRARLFAPGNHGGYGGFGLGLSSARWCATRLGGSLNLCRTSCQRTCFDLWVPSTATKVRQKTPAAGELHGRCIALVDDEPNVRSVLVRLLRRSGAHVETPEITADAAGTAAAIAALAPDVVLLDLNLGRLLGTEVLTELRMKAPEVAARVIFFSGAVGWDGAGQRIAGRPTLAKGSALDDIVRAVHSTIAEAVVAG